MCRENHEHSKPYLTPLLFCFHYKSESKPKNKILAFAELKATDVIHVKGEPPLEQEGLSLTSYTSHEQ